MMFVIAVALARFVDEAQQSPTLPPRREEPFWGEGRGRGEGRTGKPNKDTHKGRAGQIPVPSPQNNKK